MSAREIGIITGTNKNMVISAARRMVLGLKPGTVERTELQRRRREARASGRTPPPTREEQRKLEGVSRPRVKREPKPIRPRGRPRKAEEAPPPPVASILSQTPPPPPTERYVETLEPRVFDLTHLQSRCCKWPIGDPRQNAFGFCGRRATNPDTPYCPTHADVAYQQDIRRASSTPLKLRIGAR